MRLWGQREKSARHQIRCGEQPQHPICWWRTRRPSESGQHEHEQKVARSIRDRQVDPQSWSHVVAVLSGAAAQVCGRGGAGIGQPCLLPPRDETLATRDELRKLYGQLRDARGTTAELEVRAKSSAGCRRMSGCSRRRLSTAGRNGHDQP